MGSCCCCADKGDSNNSSDGGKRDPLLRSDSSEQQQVHQSRNDKQQQRQLHPNGNIVSASSPPPAAMNRGEEGTTPTTTGPCATSASRSLKEYELIAFLGQGTFAEVTLARHKATRELVAIKKISKRKVKEEGLVEHAFTERHLLAQLHHPSLVKLLQAFQSRTHLFLVLEFAQGGDLGSLLTGQQLLPPPSTLQQQQHPTNHSFTTTTNSGPLVIGQPSTTSSSFFTSAAAPHRVDIPLELLYFYSGEIAIVLQFLHEQHFIYRDLKPENILLKANGHLMLTDFGVAKNYVNQQQHQQRETTAEGGTSGRSNSFVGTRQYMSPEMLQGLPHDAATDWWSFGCWLFEMACRRRPFDAAESEFELFKNIVEEDVVFHREELQHLLYVPQTYEDAAAGGFQLHHSYNASPPTDALTRQQSSVVFHHAAGGALYGLPNNNMSFASPLLIVNRSITRFAMQTAEQPNSTIEPSSSSPTITKIGGGPEALAPTHPASSIPQQWRDRHGAELLHHLEDLIRGLLCRDPTRRYGGHEVLAHPFFQTTKAWREVFPAAFAQLDEEEEKEEVDQAQQLMPPNNNNSHHSADKKSEARCITHLKRCFALLPPPYVPKLRGSGDLRCFPYAILARHYSGGGADTAVSPNTAPRKTRKGVKGQPMPSKDLLRTIFGPDNHDNDDAAGEGPSASQPAEEKQAKPASPPSPTTAEPPAPRDGYDNNNSITLADVSYYDDAALHMSPTTILHPPPPPSIVVEHGSPIHGRGDEETTRQSLSDENSHTLNGSGDLFAGSSTSQALLDGRAYSDCDASSSGVPSGRNLEDMRAAALYPPQRSVVYADPLADSSSQFYYTSSPTRRHTMMGTQQPQRMNDRSNGRFSPRDGSSSTDAMSNVFVNYTYDARQGASYLN